jgi:hypothetical protein
MGNAERNKGKNKLKDERKVKDKRNRDKEKG